MKKIFLLLFFAIGFPSNAQTSKELTGKWQLVKWTHNGKEKDIPSYFKTDQVFQVFMENGEFQSLIGNDTHKGKWKLLKNNTELSVTLALIPIKFQITYFDAMKRVMYIEQQGTFEYKKIE